MPDLGIQSSSATYKLSSGEENRFHIEKKKKKIVTISHHNAQALHIQISLNTWN